jgi:N-acetylneuraminate synthase
MTRTGRTCFEPGDDRPSPLVIGEVALAHDGSLGLAHAFIDALARAGADAVKFQTHCAEAESTVHEPWRVPFSVQDRSRFDYWSRTAFSEPQWLDLRRHARERGLLFLSSAFSVASLDLLDRIGVDMWKLASGTLSDPGMIDRLRDARRPVLVSTGMSGWAEIDHVVESLRTADVPVAVLQCTSEYPCAAARVGLNLLAQFRERYRCPVGLSDHSGTIFPSLAAATLGAEVLEVHVTLSREHFGPDVPASVTTAELATLVEGVRFIDRMLRSPVDKDAMAAELAPMRGVFGKSIVLASSLPAGTRLAREHLQFKKAGAGIPPARIAEVLGRRLRQDMAADHPLAEQDLEGR